jgi:hypothetical protein
MRGLGGEVDGYLLHARNFGEGFFHPGNATGAGHAADGEVDCLRGQ